MPLGTPGDVTFGAGAVGAADGADDQPPKSSLLNKSAGIDAAGFDARVAAGLGAGGETGVGFCVNEKSSGFFACGKGAGLGAGGPVGVASKKLPPLSGGGEVTWAADGVDLLGIDDGKFERPEKADCGDCTGGLAGPELLKLSPPKASANPPNASFGCARGEAMPPNDGCRSCVG